MTKSLAVSRSSQPQSSPTRGTYSALLALTSRVVQRNQISYTRTPTSSHASYALARHPRSHRVNSGLPVTHGKEEQLHLSLSSRAPKVHSAHTQSSSTLTARYQNRVAGCSYRIYMLVFRQSSKHCLESPLHSASSPSSRWPRSPKSLPKSGPPSLVDYTPQLKHRGTRRLHRIAPQTPFAVCLLAVGRERTVGQ